MVKTKGGRLMNPADAFRKEQRKKENVRNKKERDWLRAANAKISKPDELRKELKDLLEKEQAGSTLNKDEKLKKRILQDAYDQAYKRKTEEELRKKAAASTAPEDSPFYHPILNPTGAAPAARAAGAAATAGIPVPKPPPLPSGPKPLGLPPPPAAPPLPAGPGPSSSHDPSAAAIPPPLPPPAGPPPGMAPLPPPPGPPPSLTQAQHAADDDEGPPGVAPTPLPPPPGPPPSLAAGHLPPPLGPPPAMMMMMMPPPPGMMLPPPAGPPPPGMMLPPPMGPPPAYSSAPLPPPAGPPPPAAVPAAGGARKEVKSTISAASTAVRMMPAAMNKAVTSMVPASVRVKREDAASKARAAKSASAAGITASSGFGLAPVSKPAPRPVEEVKPVSVDDKYQEFMRQMKEIGALE